MRVKEIERTCIACPSQWEGKTDDDRPIYIRYRWGYLSVCLGPSGGDIWSAVGGEEIYGKQLGDDLDGFLTYQRLREVLSGVVELPDVPGADEEERTFVRALGWREGG